MILNHLSWFDFFHTYFMVDSLFVLFFATLLLRGNGSKNWTEEKNLTIAEPSFKAKHDNASPSFSNVPNHYHTRWNIEPWIKEASLLSAKPLQNTSSKVLPITPFALCILQENIDTTIFQWTKHLSSSQFTVFFLEDAEQTDEIVSLDEVDHYDNSLAARSSSKKITKGGKGNFPTRKNQNRFVIRINQVHPLQHHYRHMNFLKNEITAWEKAMFFFCKVTPSYKLIWIFEEDVLVPSIQSFLKVHQDALNTKSDLISSPYFEEYPTETLWHWQFLPTFRTEHIPYPYYHGMMCAIGLTPNLLQQVKLHAHRYHQLDFLEALFPTLAIKANLTVSSSPQLITITWNTNWSCENINANVMSWYHPVKQQSKFLINCIQRIPTMKPMLMI